MFFLAQHNVDHNKTAANLPSIFVVIFYIRVQTKVDKTIRLIHHNISEGKYLKIAKLRAPLKGAVEQKAGYLWDCCQSSSSGTSFTSDSSTQVTKFDPLWETRRRTPVSLSFRVNDEVELQEFNQGSETGRRSKFTFSVTSDGPLGFLHRLQWDRSVYNIRHQASGMLNCFAVSLFIMSLASLIKCSKSVATLKSHYGGCDYVWNAFIIGL